MWNDSEKILDSASRLADYLKCSLLYKAYRKSRIQLEQHPDAAAQLRQFKQLQAHYEAEGGLSFDQERHISHHYAELMRQPAAAAFLEREKALLDTYRRVIDLIDEAWEIDLFD